MALLGQILAGVSLVAGMVAGLLVLVVTIGAVLSRLDGDQRWELLRLTLVGLAAGALGTIAYNAARAVLGALDPSPYDPFATTPIFGALLLGRTAPEPALWLAGFGFHLLNGVSFGLAYLFLFAVRTAGSARRSLLGGIGWGIFLETFQLTLYPGWLNIRTYSEFVQISFLGHVAYGSVLGLACRYLLLRGDHDLRPQPGNETAAESEQ